MFAALLIRVGRIGDIIWQRRVFHLDLLLLLGASLVTALFAAAFALIGPAAVVRAGAARGDEPETGPIGRSSDCGFRARELSRDAPLPRCGARERHRPPPVHA